MNDISRRRLLTVGVLARTVTLAGCLQGPTADGTKTPGTATSIHTSVANRDDQTTAVRGEGATSDRPPRAETPADVSVDAESVSVAFPEVADGDVTVAEGPTVSYTDPVEATFEVSGAWDGGPVPGDGRPLVVSRELPRDGPPAAFLAPVYDETDGFEYRIYANASFRDAFDWHVTGSVETRIRKGGDNTTRPVEFDEHAPGVYRDVFRPTGVGTGADDPLAVVVANYDADSIIDDRPADLAGVSLAVEQRVDETAPSVQFGFSAAEDGYELQHEGGDTVDADHLLVTVDGDPADTQFEGTVEAGSRLTFEAPTGAEVLVSYVADGTRTTLAVFTVGRTE